MRSKFSIHKEPKAWFPWRLTTPEGDFFDFPDHPHAVREFDHLVQLRRIAGVKR